MGQQNFSKRYLSRVLGRKGQHIAFWQNVCSFLIISFSTKCPSFLWEVDTFAKTNNNNNKKLETQTFCWKPVSKENVWPALALYLQNNSLPYSILLRKMFLHSLTNVMKRFIVGYNAVVPKEELKLFLFLLYFLHVMGMLLLCYLSPMWAGVVKWNQ